MRPSPLFVVVAFCFGVTVAAAAETPWLEARSAHFRVLTDGGEKSARRVATQFERIRAVFKEQWTWARVDGGEPVVILVVKDEKGMKALLPAFWARKNGVRPVGLFVPGPDRHSLIARLDVEAHDNPYEILYHEYTHRILSLNFAFLPLWLNEGLSEFYGSTRIDGDDLRQGAPRPEHILALRASGLLPLETLFKVDQTSPHYGEDGRATIFYAQSWALVHYFLLGDKGAHADALGEFVRAIARGTPESEAVKALGNLKALENALLSYVSRPALYSRKASGREAPEDGTISIRPLSAGESLAIQADLLLRSGQVNKAGTRIEESLRLEPELPAAYEVRALLSMQEGRAVDARQDMARAIELGTSSFYAYYLHGVLSLRNGTWTEEGERSLHRAIELNSLYAPSQAAVAKALSHGKERRKEAAALARRAVELQPADVPNRLAMSQVLVATGDSDEARALLETVVARTPDTAMREKAAALLARVVPKDPVLKRAFHEKGCAGGDGEACDDLAWMYAKGAGGAVDLAKAFESYDRGCRAGYLESCESAGIAYEKGQGVGADAGKAAAIYEDGCGRGHMGSCSDLAFLYTFGKGVPRDRARAATFLSKACEGASGMACDTLGSFYEHGEGVAADRVRAHELYQKACNLDDMSGCGSLGRTFTQGIGVAPDLKRAAELLQKACDGGYGKGCAYLAQAYVLGSGVPRDGARVEALMKQACEAKYAKVCVPAAPSPQERVEKMKGAEEACASGQVGACRSAGAWRSEDGDHARAFALFEKGCAGGDIPSCTQLGSAYLFGRGVARDPAKAQPLLAKACVANDAVACEAAKLLSR